MGSSLSPIIANFFMKYFWWSAPQNGGLEDYCWFCYVDDIFIIWSHGPEKLLSFNLNSIYSNIQFTMDTESDDRLQILNHPTIWQITSLCCQPWHTDPQPSAIRRVSQENWIPLQYIQTEGYDRQILTALNSYERENTSRENPTLVAFLLLAGPTFNHINRVLTRHNIKSLWPHLLPK
jgi:hypothetical protein